MYFISQYIQNSAEFQIRFFHWRLIYLKSSFTKFGNRKYTLDAKSGEYDECKSNFHPNSYNSVIAFLMKSSQMKHCHDDKLITLHLQFY